MSWKVVMQGKTADEFENASASIADIPPGTPIRFKIDFPAWAPVGNIGDIAGAEWIADRFWNDGEVEITDVYGSARQIVIEGVAWGSDPITLAVILVVVLAVLGIVYFISKIILEADFSIPGLSALGDFGAPLLIVGGVAVLIGAIALRRKFNG